MKTVMASSLLFVTTLCSAQTSYENSPYNYKNSPYNYENSQYNYQNSPYNYNNSSVNPNAANAIYDDKGRRIGYKTESNQGTTNYYSNDGTRRGYSRK